MTTADLTITFWGVRGSYPTPGPATVRFGGNTPCVEVRAGAHTIILDAGTGIIGLGKQLIARAAGQPIVATLLLSHLHHDHTQGFPFFGPAYVGASKFTIVGPGLNDHDFPSALAREMVPPVFPIALAELPALKSLLTIRETDVLQIGPAPGQVALHNRFHEPASADNGQDPDVLRITPLRSYAHPGGVLVYRLAWRGRSVVYASDVEGYASADQRLTSFAAGADLLIHDAQYTDAHYLGQRSGAPTTQGWGHSTAAMACDVARAAGVGQLVLFHHEPLYADEQILAIEAQAQALFPATVAAYEGLTITLRPQASPAIVAPPAHAAEPDQRGAS